MSDYQDHSAHSRLVRFWRAKQAINWMSDEALGWKVSDQRHILRSPHSGYVVQVSFSTYPDHPEYVFVRSTNWRAEHEPSGIYHAADARAFYKQLLAAGFVKKPE